jgi:hypothetical protein
MNPVTRISSESAGRVIELLRRWVLLRQDDEKQAQEQIRAEIRNALTKLTESPGFAGRAMAARRKRPYRLSPEEVRAGGLGFARALSAMSPEQRAQATSFWKRRKNLKGKYR